MKRFLSVAMCLVLAGCMDPMKDVPRLAEVDLPAEESARQVVQPAPKEIERKGLFARLRAEKVPHDAPAVTEPELNAETSVAAAPAIAPDLPSETETPDAPSPAAMPPETTSEPAQETAGGGDAAPQAVAEPAQVSDEKTPKTAAAKPRKGFLGFLRGDDKPAPAAAKARAAEAPVKAETPSEPVASEPSPKPETTEVAAVSEPVKPVRAGLFGGGGARSKAAKNDVAPGTVLPYGKVGRVCGLSSGKMGKKVAQFPERGGKYKIYDSDPSKTTLRNFYLTGFRDGCARQFSAAVAVFGSPTMHERLRYGLPAKLFPYSETDKAYEGLKSKVCRVPRAKPCGAKIKQVERSTVFVSLYERYENNKTWSNILLHNGTILAQDLKSN